MLYKSVLPLALATGVFAQSDTPSLTEALASQNDTLSSLTTLIGTLPDEVVQSLGEAQNITILAPSNDALEAFLNNTAASAAIAADPGLILAVLQYHILNGTYYASNITGADGPLFVPTLLTNETYANVTGGQRVEVIPPEGDDSDVTFYSGLKENSTVQQADLNFTGGTIHIIDRVLTLPLNISDTLRAANLTATLGAVQRAAVGEALGEARDLTVFAPDNSAFAAIANLVGGDNGLNQSALASILEYHVVAGQVLYSDLIENTTLETLGGGELTVSVVNGSVFVNSAEVVVQDVLISNGVVHVINNVLNPDNTTATPDPSASTPVPAFTGASTVSGGANPLTSGVEGPTSTAPIATGANPGAEGGGGTSTSTEGAPMRTAAVGVAALFGAGVVAFNNM
ncbi:Fasciclin-like arabinogalactan protein like [Verticillium longisporum]|uniref:Fasciclin-like arabinogalactan protein like n=1 Tax=Verticillium longisporum TaxID=100787 RepID=A0A8I3AIM5_VERLO|nr:Fasciclin-like arabinogalactan protein like [Verticillium longisporum]